MAGPSTYDRFAGCLIGLAVGDALGAPYEGLPPGAIGAGGLRDQIAKPPSHRTFYYTDDTEMAIGVAETLIEYGRIDQEALCTAFADNYHPQRGYGGGARRIIEAKAAGGDWRSLAQNVFPGGSLGNGAAMRVAPVGLMFHDDLDTVAEQARLSALPTHVHPLGIDGARLLALAVALATRTAPFDRPDFFEELAGRAETEPFRTQLSQAAGLRRDDPLTVFGNGIEAHRSVVTAIACFAASPDDYVQVVSRAVSQGGDTDTLAAMAGAIAGAYLGINAIPAHLAEALEDTPKGRVYLKQLAADLYEAYGRRAIG